MGSVANRPSLDDYIDVAERIREFKGKHPEGTLQTISWEATEIAGSAFIVYHAAAFRTPDDETPGHGIAWEPFPGKTPYTKDSELMNAETAAWGRAIVAVGIASKKIASRQEVGARQEPEEQRPAIPTIPTDRALRILDKAVEVGLAKAFEGAVPNLSPVLIAKLADVGVDTGKIGHLNVDQAEAVEAWLENEAA